MTHRNWRRSSEQLKKDVVVAIDELEENE